MKKQIVNPVRNWVAKNDFNQAVKIETRKEKLNRPERKQKHKKDLRGVLI